MTILPPSQEVDSRFRYDWLLAAGLIVAIFLLIGLAVSAVLHSATPKFFESHAVVLIERRSPAPETDDVFRIDDFITEVLVTYDLNELATLRDLPVEDQILHIQNNFEVQRSEETNDLYHLRFRSRDAIETQTFLATLVSTYEKHLIERYCCPTPDVAELLRRLKKKYADELVAKIEKVEEVERQITAGQNGEDNQAKLKEHQKELELFQEKLDIASRPIGSEGKVPGEEEPEGFNFTIRSPASKGVLTTTPLYVFLLVGGGGGAMSGLVIAGFMLAVLSNRT